MNKDEIVEELFSLQDKTYAAFQGKLIPNYDHKKIIGVRTPALRTFAKKLFLDEEKDAFLRTLPHQYFDENQLHAFVISLEKDFDKCITQVEAFLPFIDNWATCDQLLPKTFKKNGKALLPYIKEWIVSDRIYTVRFAIGALMRYFLDENFQVEYLDWVAKIRSREYYVNMMIAWYFATALAKQYEATIPYIEEKRLDDWTHNKAIQKSVESYRISLEQKAYLRTLKLEKKKAIVEM